MKNNNKTSWTTQALLSNLAWIQIVVGLLFLLTSSYFEYEIPKYKDVLEKIGLTVLSSGVFASVLKSFQFTGIFKKEIEEVMLTNKFIEKRNDLEDLWHSISTNVFQQKFPEIKDDLLSIILNDYFPTNHKYFYENVIYTIEVEKITDDNIIHFTQNIVVKGVKQDGEESSTNKITRKIKVEKSQNPSNYSCELLEIVSNGDILDIEKYVIDREEVSNGDLILKIELPIGESKTFEISTKEKRKYSIKDDNTKLFTVNCITKEMNISICYPDNVKVLFFPLGVVKPFVDLHVDHKNKITKMNRNLILPWQGFGLTFDSIEEKK